MIGLENKGVYKCKQEGHCRFVYHERQFPSIAVRFKSDICLSSIDDAVTAIWEGFGDNLPHHSPGGAVISDMKIEGDKEADWDF